MMIVDRHGCLIVDVTALFVLALVKYYSVLFGWNPLVIWLVGKISISITLL